ncbi:transporter substrate-binding domain-containing protein [Aliiglaciecola sp. LCG003]|uniref:substrate-binding periplasmic protein n=1 Tax=Aliiglaciecola sp. LCG003 TaxID=3053655 RepID=UPI0025738C3D|nr:transporter substrate-binding domain-containing protein [Aliiglaciecola sp. LCG003]WJG10342.1 transporter substrate-binding domain-containing protein [Aliiglaciecola sp. LCG003]
MKTCYLVLVVVSSLALIACSPESKQSVNAEQNPAITTQPLGQSTPVDPQCSYILGFDVWEPYQYVDVDNRVRGLDVELITTVLSNMGCSIEFKQGTWVMLLEDLKQGQVDILLGASKTQPREEYAFFSEPYRSEEFSLYIRKDDQKRASYSDLDDFIANGSKIGVVSDYFYGPRISILLDGSATSKQFVSGIMGELNIARLLDQDIDGFLEDSFVGASMLRRKGLSQYITPHGFTIKTGEIYVMFSKDSVEEQKVDEFNHKLSEFRSSTGYKELMGKYSL